MTVAYLHFIQPLARVRGRIRGHMLPPVGPPSNVEPQTRGGPRPSLSEAWRAVLLLSGAVAEHRFWSETWTSSERVLSNVTDWLRRSRAVRAIELDEGWSDDRDVSIPVGRWAWLDLRALAEDHGGGKTLLRISTHLRPTMFGVASALALGVALLVAAAVGVALRWPPAGAITGVVTIAFIGLALWRTAQATALLWRSMARVTVGQGMISMPSGPARPTADCPLASSAPTACGARRFSS
jgi:hypothetical protein